MASIFDLFDPKQQPGVPRLEGDALDIAENRMGDARSEIEASTQTGEILSTAAAIHSKRIMETHSQRSRRLMEASQALLEAFRLSQSGGGLAGALMEYQRDAAERAVLTADALRKRGDIFLDHEAANCPPVLIYDYEVIMDGKDLPYPCNYMLLKILPPEGITIDDTRRPYVIIDPRAGHGPGIGGFKTDSQVGVALRAGHPVYFVAFRSRPEPGQYLSYVTRAEAAFIREVMRRHPDASKPVITGNCQGGWATLLLAATNTDLTGPIVINGAPVAPWSGKVGENPMRYNAGVLGGTWMPMFLSDLGGGIFDGANLVMNFEVLNPGRTLFRKYTDLFRDIDKGDKTFLEFEKWWGGYFMLTEPEIKWIVEQLFVGNRLSKNEARIEPGRPVDMKAIRAPIIAFASFGDNITPVQQALNWIPETYADVQEIRIRGQRIVYMVHDQVGHLGIFVSSQIARKEHAEVTSTLKTIEALAPGLYEMTIEAITEQDGRKHFTVGFAERTLDDIRALDDGTADERPFAAVARASEVQAQIYDATMRPFVKAMVSPTSAELGRAMHPKRLERALASSKNPVMAQMESWAGKVRESRTKADPSNPFLAAEQLWVDSVEQMIDYVRDTRDMMYELTFYNMWSTPWMRVFGRTHEARRTLKNTDELRGLPEVAAALYNIERGGFAEAVIRMLVLLAENRKGVRRDRLERSSKVLTQDEPFASLGAERRALIIHEQTLIATYEPLRAVETLPVLLSDPAERELALKVVRYVPGSTEEMSPETLQLLQRFHEVLGQPHFSGEVTEDPLEGAQAGQAEAAAANAETARAAAAARRPRAVPEVKAGNDMRLTNRTFAELMPGETAELRRLITPDDLYVFAAASGNYNPMHLPSTDVDGDGRPENVAPGMFVASMISAVLGTMLPGPGTLYRRQVLDFHDRAHAGEELLCRVEVTGKAEDGSVSLETQVTRVADGAPVVTGSAVVLAPATRFDRDDIEVPGLIVQSHRHFEALVARARALPPLPVAVVCPDDGNSLGGAVLAAKEGLIEAILIGDAARIRATAETGGHDLTGLQIIDIQGDQAAATEACRLVHEGRAGAVMKGHLHTDDLLKPMLDKVNGLRVGRRFTHVFVMDVPGRPEPVMVTDAAINIAPDLATKVDITQNAIDLALSIGMEPLVGVLSAVETVNPAIQSSIDAALLSKMAERGQITGGLVDGPLAMDNAVDIGAARTKGLRGGVAGHANILVVPGIDSGNMLAKQLSFISHAEGAGLVLGARVPVILNSRSDSPMSRLASCAVAALHHARTGEGK